MVPLTMRSTNGRPFTSIPSLLALEDLTNESRSSAEASQDRLHSSQDNTGKRRLRRTDSFRPVNRYTDSSELLPSEEDSVFVAEPVFPQENVAEVGHTISSNNSPLPTVKLPLSPSFEDLTHLPGNFLSVDHDPRPYQGHNRSGSHSNWPEIQLNTIMEQNSFNTLRNSLSEPGLGNSRQKNPEIGLNQANHISISEQLKDPLRSREPCKGTPVGAESRHLRSISLNDLSCLYVCVPGAGNAAQRSPSSSSSTEFYRIICPTGPKMPTHPPPERMPTPPGLPTFGTEEAIRFRMPRSSTQDRLDSILAYRRSRSISHNSDGQDASLSPSSLGSPEMGPRNPPMDMFKRILGLVRTVTPPPQEHHQRAALPPQVQALARAPDGTLVRGTFGNRTSGHGIGRRTLENHPLLQDPVSRRGRRRRSRTEEEIRRIDKACEEVESARAEADHQQLTARQEFGPPLPRARVVRDLGRAISGTQPSALSLPNSPLSNPAIAFAPYSPPSLRTSILSPPHSDPQSRSRLYGPQPYSPYLGASSTRVDDVAGVREFVDQGERDSVSRVRERIDKEKDKGDCERCMIWFCMCCCELDCNAEANRGVGRKASRDERMMHAAILGRGDLGGYLSHRETMRYR